MWDVVKPRPDVVGKMDEVNVVQERPMTTKAHIAIQNEVKHN